MTQNRLKKGKHRDISKIAIKSRDFTARVSNFPKFLRFRYILRIVQSFGRSFPKNLCVEGGKVLNYPVHKHFSIRFISTSNL